MGKRPCLCEDGRNRTITSIFSPEQGFSIGGDDQYHDSGNSEHESIVISANRKIAGRIAQYTDDRGRRGRGEEPNRIDECEAERPRFVREQQRRNCPEHSHAAPSGD